MSEWHEALNAIELRLLATWVRGPRLRELWTPEKREMFTHRAQAIAKACAVLEAQGFAAAPAGDLGVQLMVQLHQSGDLTKHWGAGDQPLPVASSTDPERDLHHWRELRCLFALRSSLTETLLAATPSSDLSTVRQRILEAAEVARPEERSASYKRPEETHLGVQLATRRDQSGSFTGFTRLDQATGGLRPGHVWVLGAPTNWGKTNWLIAVREHYLAMHGAGAMLVSCEDPPELVAVRALTRRAGINCMHARDGRLTPLEAIRAQDELSRSLESGPSPVLLDGRGRKVEQIAQEIRNHVARFGLRVVLVDYLQCIGAEHKSQDRRAEVNHIARTLTDAIKTSGAAGVLASQVTGDDIRESRDVEHAAEVVLIGRREAQGPHKLFLKKNKAGPAGFEFELDWDAVTGSFRTRAEEDHGHPYSN